MLTNDASVLALLFGVLAFVFYTSNLPNRFWQRFYTFIPSIMLCFFIPGLLSSFGIISAEKSGIDEMASRYLLPSCLVLLIVNIDFQAIKRLGPKAIIVFLAGALGIMVGGPLAIWIVKNISPETIGGVGDDETWRGLATIAGSWIGGNANQMALKEVFHPSAKLFSQTSVIDVLMSEMWLVLLLYGVSISARLDKRMGADTSVIEELKVKMKAEQLNNQQIPVLKDFVMIGALAFGVTGFAHLVADFMAPYILDHHPNLTQFSLGSKSFWVITTATLCGLLLSQTKARNLERTGASRIGTLFLYLLITTIGMQMNLFDAFRNPGLLVVGGIWIITHAIFTIVASSLVKAPFFFTAVGSQANVGGVASASVVAAAFHPSLAPVGVLLAILGNAIGTYCGYLTGLLMQWVSG